MRVLISANSAWNLLNFRNGLIISLLEAGHEVIACSPLDEHVQDLQKIGCKFSELPMDANGINPFKDLWLFLRFSLILLLHKPNVLLTFTAKPNIYGSIAARFLGVKVINNISGLGFAFIKGGWLSNLLQLLYKIALLKTNKVFFQNKDDIFYFVQQGLISVNRADLLPGSGVNLKKFNYSKIPCLQDSGQSLDKPFCFLLIARMLKDKGVEEFVQAARKLKSKLPNVEFALLGPLDSQNSNSISSDRMEAWVNEGLVSYWGKSKDVRNEICRADCVVLPSYREGTPRALLEAAAMGRVLIATDVPGCREIVRHEFNGLLCKSRNVDDLAQSMVQLINLPSTILMEWGKNSRLLVEQNFDEKFVIEKYIKAIDSLC